MILKMNCDSKNVLDQIIYSISFARGTRAVIPTSSMVKYNVALGGITPPAPLVPYPRAGGMMTCFFPPIFIPDRSASSQPAMTCLTPTLNTKGDLRS
jgi:hypothetical protein